MFLVFLCRKTVLVSQKEPKKEPHDQCAVKLPYTIGIFGCDNWTFDFNNRYCPIIGNIPCI